MTQKWLFDPFDKSYKPKNIIETHQVQYDADLNRYLVKLNQIPLRGFALTVKDLARNTFLTEVPITQTPLAGQFRVDYEDLLDQNYTATGLIEFNVADNNKNVEVNYWGVGEYLKGFVHYDRIQNLLQSEYEQFLKNISLVDNDIKIYNSFLKNNIREYENPIDPIAYYNATGQEYFLQVGEVARIEFTNQTQVPLRIATQDGTYYEMHLIPSNTSGTSGGVGSPIYLNPNNTTFNNAFYHAHFYRISSEGNSSYDIYSSFRIGWAFSSIVMYITNRTIYKSIKGFYDVYGIPNHYPCYAGFSTDWRNTTTQWTSLGTIVFPQNSSGTILIRRLL